MGSIQPLPRPLPGSRPQREAGQGSDDLAKLERKTGVKSIDEIT